MSRLFCTLSWVSEKMAVSKPPCRGVRRTWVTILRGVWLPTVDVPSDATVAAAGAAVGGQLIGEPLGGQVA
jgi:hypothetical protein